MKQKNRSTIFFILLFNIPTFFFGQPKLNLIKNGDFHSKSINFFSEYTYTATNTTEGEFYIGNNPQNWYHLHYSCGDHTTGTGNMLLVNGSPIAGAKIWELTVSVKENTVYTFSFWITSISRPNPAQLKIAFNNEKNTTIYKAGKNTCNWSEIKSTWHSGANRTVKITIQNENTIEYGNDFALDDLYFAETDRQITPFNCTSRTRADFEFSITQCLKVSFEPKYKKTKIAKRILWDFGDGKSSALWKPVHQYKQPGIYKVTAVITSQPDCRDTFTRILNIKPAKADFSYSEMGQPGKLAFKAEKKGQINDWDFGDGNYIRQASVAFHEYKASGTYTTTLVSTTELGCSDSVQKSIFVVLPDKIIKDPEAGLVPENIILQRNHPLEKRKKDIIRTIEVVQDSVTVLLYDNGIIDGDSITLLLDDQVLLIHQLLARTPLQLRIPVSRDKDSHDLTMYAENLGSIPPNTAYMVILDGNVKYEIYISSSKKSNGVVLFTRKI